jgi:hypothetical protein
VLKTFSFPETSIKVAQEFERLEKPGRDAADEFGGSMKKGAKKVTKNDFQGLGIPGSW